MSEKIESYKYVPNECKGKDAEFSGHLMLKAVLNDESWEVFDKIGMEMDDDGNPHFADKKVSTKLSSLTRLAKEYMVECHLTHKETKTKYKTYDELNRDRACRSLLLAVGTFLMGGVSPKKK